MTASKHAEVIALAAERLRDASQAAHQMPARLTHIAAWLELAAQVHNGHIPCDWCATGACPAVDAALALLGDPRTELIARRDPQTVRR